MGDVSVAANGVVVLNCRHCGIEVDRIELLNPLMRRPFAFILRREGRRLLLSVDLMKL